MKLSSWNLFLWTSVPSKSDGPLASFLEYHENMAFQGVLGKGMIMKSSLLIIIVFLYDVLIIPGFIN